MKSMLFAALLVLTAGYAKANDVVTASLIDHVTTVTQFESGRTKLALMSSFIQIGNIKGKSIFDLQAGFNTNVKPQPDEDTGANLVFGGWFKVNSLIQENVKFPEEWKFLKSIEHGPALYYDSRNHDWRGSYQVGLAFSLNPK